MLYLETEVKFNLGLLQIKRDGAGAAVVLRESYDIACRQPKTFRGFRTPDETVRFKKPFLGESPVFYLDETRSIAERKKLRKKATSQRSSGCGLSCRRLYDLQGFARDGRVARWILG